MGDLADTRNETMSAIANSYRSNIDPAEAALVTLSSATEDARGQIPMALP